MILVFKFLSRVRRFSSRSCIIAHTNALNDCTRVLTFIGRHIYKGVNHVVYALYKCSYKEEQRPTLIFSGTIKVNYCSPSTEKEILLHLLFSVIPLYIGTRSTIWRLWPRIVYLSCWMLHARNSGLCEAYVYMSFVDSRSSLSTMRIIIIIFVYRNN